MEMRKADLALDKAIESGDPQLGIVAYVYLFFASVLRPCSSFCLNVICL